MWHENWWLKSIFFISYFLLFKIRYIYFYLPTVHSTIQSVAQGVQCRMVGCLVEDGLEIIWKKTGRDSFSVISLINCGKL
jgi:hypothetical protein